MKVFSPIGKTEKTGRVRESEFQRNENQNIAAGRHGCEKWRKRRLEKRRHGKLAEGLNLALERRAKSIPFPQEYAPLIDTQMPATFCPTTGHKEPFL